MPAARSTDPTRYGQGPERRCTRAPATYAGPPGFLKQAWLDSGAGRGRVGLAPPDCQREGGRECGTASPYRWPARFAIPQRLPSVGQSVAMGHGRLQYPLGAAFTDCTASPPVAALLPLGGPLGELPALGPTGAQQSRERWPGGGGQVRWRLTHLGRWRTSCARCATVG